MLKVSLSSRLFFESSPLFILDILRFKASILWFGTPRVPDGINSLETYFKQYLSVCDRDSSLVTKDSGISSIM